MGTKGINSTEGKNRTDKKEEVFEEWEDNKMVMEEMVQYSEALSQVESMETARMIKIT